MQLDLGEQRSRRDGQMDGFITKPSTALRPQTYGAGILFNVPSWFVCIPEPRYYAMELMVYSFDCINPEWASDKTIGK